MNLLTRNLNDEPVAFCMLDDSIQAEMDKAADAIRKIFVAELCEIYRVALVDDIKQSQIDLYSTLEQLYSKVTAWRKASPSGSEGNRGTKISIENSITVLVVNNVELTSFEWTRPALAVDLAMRKSINAHAENTLGIKTDGMSRADREALRIISCKREMIQEVVTGEKDLTHVCTWLSSEVRRATEGRVSFPSNDPDKLAKIVKLWYVSWLGFIHWTTRDNIEWRYAV